MTTKIYLVTDGEYSDFKVIHIASTPEKAEYAKRLYKADNDVEEWVLDELQEHPRGMLYYYVWMQEDGTSRICQATPFCLATQEWEPSALYERMMVVPCVRFAAWAKDEQHAVKIANERRVQLIASGEWTTDWSEWRDRQDTE